MSLDITIRIDDQGRISASAPVFAEDLRTLPRNKDLMCRIWTARNPQQTKWFHAMLDEVVKAGYWDGDRESLKRFAKLSTGRCEEFVEKETGKVFLVPDSVAESAMDGERFNSFIRDLERVFAERLGVDISKIRDLAKASSATDYTPREPKASAVQSPAPDGGAASAGGEAEQAPVSPPAASPHAELLAQFAHACGNAPNPREAYRRAEAFWKDHAKPDAGTPAREALRGLYALALEKVTGNINGQTFTKMVEEEIARVG